MSTLDLYEDGFPHSTREGYEKGCRSRAGCPGRLENGFSCAEANIRFNGDFEYRRLVQAGKTPAEISALAPAHQPKPAAPAKTTNTATVHTPPPPVREPIAQTPTPEPAAEKQRGGRKALPLDHPDFPHGTANGFARGCKDETTCPGTPTCRQALRDYQQDLRARKRKTSPGEGSTPTTEPAGNENQVRETGGTTPAESEATIRTPEPSTVDHTPPTPDEPWHDPTHGQIDRDIQDAVDEMNPKSVGQRVAIQREFQDRRDRGEIDPTPPTGGITLADVQGDIRAHVEQQILDERQRQIELGYTAEHDDEHGPDHLLLLAFEYLTHNDVVKAGALFLALRELLGRRRVAQTRSDLETAERIKQLTESLEETRADLREAYGAADRHNHDWAKLYAAHETLKAERTIDTQLAKLIPALAGELEPTGGEGAAQVDAPGAEMLLQPEAGGGIRVALRGNAQPMRFHVGFENGQASTVSVSLGGE